MKTILLVQRGRFSPDDIHIVCAPHLEAICESEKEIRGRLEGISAGTRYSVARTISLVVCKGDSQSHSFTGK